MQDMNDILNPPAEEKETAPEAEDTTTDKGQGETTDEVTGETTQVAAEGAESGAQTKTELAALAKERERIRQMKAQLETEKAQLEAERKSLSGQGGQARPEETGNKEESGGGKADLRSELKELNRKYRAALQDAIMDPDDEDLAKAVEDLEDRMEEVRISMLSETSRAASEQEKAESAYRAAYAALHDEFPFLSPEHPQCDQELIDDINTYMTGRIRQGDSNTEALEKAVRRFAPAYAERAGLTGGGKAEGGKEESGELARKLSKGGFSEVRSASRTQQRKPFTGPTPMTAILGSKG